MSQADLLIELGTEELPPKALKSLSAAFSKGIIDGLKEQRLSHGETDSFASPRRLAIRLRGLQTRQEDQATEKLGPHLSNAYDKEGKPTKAAEGFARGCGVALDALETTEDAKGERMVFRANVPGQDAAELIPGIVEKSLAALPIPKRMRWGSSRAEFVRPVHWLLIRLGDECINTRLLGCESGLESRGHRFHAPETFSPGIDSYESDLESRHVVASFARRRAMIAEQVAAEGKKLGGEAVIGDALLDEVTALVEWPVALAGSFEQDFLKVPPEALISSMREHQKYFHVVDGEGKLMPHFITVSNIESKDPAQVISGNERVIRPRLSDARFFFETDCKNSLTGLRERLKPIVFQAQLGTVFEKTERIAALAAKIAADSGEDEALARRAGELCKSDLASDMVLEFDDMQGIAGSYYAENDGEDAAVALAMKGHYLPAFAGDALPENGPSAMVALADRLDTISGIFGIGQTPTGSKDPFALRRACLGVLRILIEQQRPLDLADLVEQAIAGHRNQHQGLSEGDSLARTILDYCLERLKAYFADQGISTAVYQAVAAKSLSQPLDIARRVHAVQSFQQLPEALALAEANKRVSNLLSENETDIADAIDASRFSEDAEKALASAIENQQQQLQPLLAAGDYEQALKSLAALRSSVDSFFDKVMVMDDDANIRANRLALLAQLRELFFNIADISQLVPAK